MNVIIFGTGQVAKYAFRELNSNYHVLFFVDNDHTKWGTTFEQYLIKCPDEIMQYECCIVVASIRYELEMVMQLLNMGIKRENIYLCQGVINGELRRYVVFMDMKRERDTMEL